MICKELDPMFGTSIFAKAGYKAEEKMAFYLECAFKNNPQYPKFAVINNLRFPHPSGNGSFVQIDHLILTEICAFIIESKSVSTKVRYDRKQWQRLRNNHWEAMQSPVEQAKRQGEALRTIIQAKKEELRSKFLFAQGGFLGMPIHVIVAISDNGIIDYDKSNDIFENIVVKADTVVSTIEKYYKEDYRIVKSKEGGWQMPEKDLIRTKDFLLTQHVVKTAPDQQDELNDIENVNNELNGQQQSVLKQDYAPYVISSSQKRIYTVEKTATVIQRTSPPSSGKEEARYCYSSPNGKGHNCKSSSSNRVYNSEPAQKDNESPKIHSKTECPRCQGKIQILWGELYKNYYWHCNNCGYNESINFKCPECSKKLKIKKKGIEYFIYCESCEIEGLFFSETWIK